MDQSVVIVIVIVISVVISVVIDAVFSFALASVIRLVLFSFLFLLSLVPFRDVTIIIRCEVGCYRLLVVDRHGDKDDAGQCCPFWNGCVWVSVVIGWLFGCRESCRVVRMTDHRSVFASCEAAVSALSP